MMSAKGLTILIIVFGLIGTAIVVIFVYPSLNRYLSTQVVPGLDEEEQVIEKTLKLTIPEDAKPGTYKFNVGWGEAEDGSPLSLGEEVSVVICGSGGGNDGDNDDGNDDRGGGNDGDGEDEEQDEEQGEEEVQVRTYTYSPHKGHAISGAYSGVREDSGLKVVTLAHSTARLAKKIVVPRDNYWLYVNVKHDKPGPVDMAVYLNNKAWKVLRFDKNDNKYRTHRVGLLRNFSGGTIRFRFLNDTYDKSDPSNEVKDRNLHIASWGLTTDTTRLSLANTVSTGIKRIVGGVILMPRLNQIIREELGTQFVTFKIWRYYAVRLAALPGVRETIQSEDHLRNVMRYWKGVRPSNPRGD